MRNVYITISERYVYESLALYPIIVAIILTWHYYIVAIHLMESILNSKWPRHTYWVSPQNVWLKRTPQLCPLAGT